MNHFFMIVGKLIFFIIAIGLVVSEFLTALAFSDCSGNSDPNVLVQIPDYFQWELVLLGLIIFCWFTVMKYFKNRVLLFILSVPYLVLRGCLAVQGLIFLSPVREYNISNILFLLVFMINGFLFYWYYLKPKDE